MEQMGASGALDEERGTRLIQSGLRALSPVHRDPRECRFVIQQTEAKAS